MQPSSPNLTPIYGKTPIQSKWMELLQQLPLNIITQPNKAVPFMNID